MNPIDHKPSPENQQAPSRQDKPEEDAALLRRNREGMIFTVLFAATLLSSLYPLPGKLFSGLFAIAALVWAVRYFIAGVRARRAGGWVLIGILGTLACLWMLLQAIGMLILYPQQKAYEDCVSSAVTEQASVECQSEHLSQLQQMIKDLQGAN